MKPDRKKTDAELLAWVAAIVQREQDQGTFGRVSIHLEKGRITRATIEKSEMPAFTNDGQE